MSMSYDDLLPPLLVWRHTVGWNRNLKNKRLLCERVLPFAPDFDLPPYTSFLWSFRQGRDHQIVYDLDSNIVKETIFLTTLQSDVRHCRRRDLSLSALKIAARPLPAIHWKRASRSKSHVLASSGLVLLAYDNGDQ